MDSKSGSVPIKDEPMLRPTNPTRNSTRDDELPPVYYNSEPSSQPPRYPDARSGPATLSSSSKPNVPSANISTLDPGNQHRYSAQASTVAAVLASPYIDLDAQRRADRKSKTLRERWKDFKERNFGQEYNDSKDRSGSSAEWNVQGGKLSGGLVSPYRRKSTK
jgi:hypothetical protein